MNKLLGVLNSDVENLDGSRSTAGALVQVLYENFEAGIPNLIGHDFHRPIGWAKPIAVHIEPGLTRLVGMSEIAEKEEERQGIFQLVNDFLAGKVKRHQAEVEALKVMLQPQLHGTEKVLCLDCVTLVGSDLVTRLLPDLFNQKDNDGLVPLDCLAPVGPGAFQIGNYVIFAHPFFRRSASRVNNLNSAFLEQVQSLAKNGLPVKIALDTDMVGLVETYKPRIELEYWWGPKFNDELASIPVGVTHYEANENERIFHGISRTEFWWRSGDGEHFLEAEELPDIPSAVAGSVQYACRYIHSIVNESSGQITHFDGAVRAYSEDEMHRRLKLNISGTDKSAVYTKLWKVSGSISVSIWKSILSNYFRDNHLVGEYLGASPEKPNTVIIKNERKTNIDAVASSYIPYYMLAGSGVRISLSYHSIPNDKKTPRKVISLDKLQSLDRDIPIVESCVLELKKALKRLDASLSVAPEVKFLNYKDFYANFPVIVHNNVDLQNALDKTLSAIKMLISAFEKQGYHRVASYNIQFPVGGKQLLISVLGHVHDLRDWLSNPLCRPPTSQDGIAKWVDDVSEYLTKKHGTANDNPRLFDTIMQSGVLLIKRRLIDNEKLLPNGVDINGAIQCELVIPDNDSELISLVEAKRIVPAPALLILKSRCAKCGAVYQECDDSKLLDDGVVEEITDLEPVFFFWTDHSVWQWNIGGHSLMDGFHHFGGRIRIG